MKIHSKLFGLLAFGGIAATANAVELAVTVDNIREARGSLYIRVYDKNSPWLSQEKQGPKLTEVIDLTAAKAEQTITRTIDLPAGTYALTAIHDLNNNGIMDTNWLGIPTEPVGESEGGVKRIRKPAFSDCSFDLQAPTAKAIKLINY